LPLFDAWKSLHEPKYKEEQRPYRPGRRSEATAKRGKKKGRKEERKERKNEATRSAAGRMKIRIRYKPQEVEN
jgi:hypothetical protein